VSSRHTRAAGDTLAAGQCVLKTRSASESSRNLCKTSLFLQWGHKFGAGTHKFLKTVSLGCHTRTPTHIPYKIKHVQAERFTEQAVAEVLQLLLYWTMGIALPSGIFAVAFFLPHSRY